MLRRAWDAGEKVTKLIGFDSTEDHRTFADGKGMKICPAKDVPDYGDRYSIEYWLRNWALDREALIRIILAAGLPVPPKSACFFCPAMKQFEIEKLRREEPELYALAIEMERLYRIGPHYRGDGVWTVKAMHKVTREKMSVEVVAESAAHARLQFRTQMKDTSSPYQWNCNPSPAVPGLGRSFPWATFHQQYLF